MGASCRGYRWRPPMPGIEDYELRAPGISYGRDKNPTYLVAERVLAELEGAAGALLFSSGLAGAVALFQTLKPGDHVVAPVIMYHGLAGLVDTVLRHLAGRHRLLRRHRRRRPGRRPSNRAVRVIVWVETPCQPYLGRHRHRRRRDRRSRGRRAPRRGLHRGDAAAHAGPWSSAPTSSSIPRPST